MLGRPIYNIISKNDLKVALQGFRYHLLKGPWSGARKFASVVFWRDAGAPLSIIAVATPPSSEKKISDKKLRVRKKQDVLICCQSLRAQVLNACCLTLDA